jgi:thioredoxin 1
MAKLTTVTQTNFSRNVLESDLPVAVDFTAPWCPPCRRATPILEDIAVEYAGRLKVVEVDADEEIQLTSRYGVHAMPTLLIFKRGQEVERLVGLRSKSGYSVALDHVLTH